MRTFTFSRTVAAPPARVFEVFTDLRNAPGRIKAILKLDVLTDGPVGKGTRFRETRKMFGKEATETMEITDFQPGRSYTVRAESCGARYTTMFAFAPAGAGTRVDMTFTIESLTFWAKLFSPLMGLMSGVIRKCFEADLADLQAAAEGRTPPGSPAAVAQPT